jgi:FkbM family methyltransferase
MTSLLRLRTRKVCFSLIHSSCWIPLVNCVAPSVEHESILAGLDSDLLIDVGANRGQFTLMTRVFHPRIPVHAFEPLPAEAAVYRRLLARRPGITLHEIALGAEEGEAQLHVSARPDSSSLLPIGELQTTLFPATGTIRTLRVLVKPLDSLPQVWANARRAILKLDVQGFELSVLRGARRALANCAYVYAECSHVPLYTGQALYPEVEAFLSSEAFFPASRNNEQWSGGHLIQADYLFERDASK